MLNTLKYFIPQEKKMQLTSWKAIPGRIIENCHDPKIRYNFKICWLHSDCSYPLFLGSISTSTAYQQLLVVHRLPFALCEAAVNIFHRHRLLLRLARQLAFHLMKIAAIRENSRYAISFIGSNSTFATSLIKKESEITILTTYSLYTLLAIKDGIFNI